MIVEMVATEYICVIYVLQGTPTRDDFRNKSDSTFLYVAGE